ncbi:hypothetical protein chiPu_0011898 [Chiloscyllium punctatum]|uniref:Uncharacterized protein n=1 Tax=Chiloscyllium punctatum TaxID=137246 RepID=A0A401SSR1_CHIPU|nr:hypothetical protein [Chiloscyllium punctatum]
MDPRLGSLTSIFVGRAVSVVAVEAQKGVAVSAAVTALEGLFLRCCLGNVFPASVLFFSSKPQLLFSSF